MNNKSNKQVHWHDGACDPQMKLTQKNWKEFLACCKRLEKVRPLNNKDGGK